MKPVFKCDYCDKTGTEDEIKKHELECFDNYDRKSCFTCVHKELGTCTSNMLAYNCKLGKEIPEGKIFEFCPQYGRKEKTNLFSDLFGFKGF
jgi:hypothetical protein